MKVGLKRTGRVLAALLVIMMAGAVGYMIAGGAGNFGLSRQANEALILKSAVPSPAPSAGPAAGNVPAGTDANSRDSAAPQNSSSSGASSPAPQSLVIMNASMDVLVKDARNSVDAIRAIATASGSQIAELHVSAGQSEPPTPMGPGAAGRTAASSPTPATAAITLRVPAEKLGDVERQVAKIGTVVSLTSSQSDVTQQHIDLAARLKNLKAEEAQLRSFYRKAKSVDDLLSVQQELSDVQGQIESMQAQVDYLERQAALATLTIALTEPGPVVRPAGTSWGFSAAVTRGIQGAAALVRAFVTVAIALSPLALLALLLWAVFTLVRRRHRPAAAAAPTAADEPGPDGS